MKYIKSSTVQRHLFETTLIYSESQSKFDEWVVSDTGVDIHSKEEERTIVDGPAPFFFSSAFLDAFSALCAFLAANAARRFSRSVFFFFAAAAFASSFYA
jgi:hypothetical protein